MGQLNPAKKNKQQLTLPKVSVVSEVLRTILKLVTKKLGLKPRP